MGLDADRPHRPHPRPSHESRTSSTSARSAAPPARSRSAASTARPTAARTWKRVLFVDANTGCSGLTMDPHNPDTSLRRHVAGGDAHLRRCSAAARRSGVYSRTTAATPGRTSTATGLPNRRSARSTWPSRRPIRKRVYALIQTADQGSLWRSDDGGANWTAVNWQRDADRPRGLLHPPGRLPDERRTKCSSRTAVSGTRTDGGKTFRTDAAGAATTHDIWMRSHEPRPLRHDRRRRHCSIDHRPRPAASRVSRCRSGRCITSRSTTTCRTLQQHAGRRHHARAEQRSGGRPERARSGQARRLRTRRARRLPALGARGIGRLRIGLHLPDLTDPTSSGPPATATKSRATTRKTKLARSVSPWMHTLDSAPNEAKYRCHWTPPLAIDPFDHNTVYYGCQVIFRTTNGGQSWTVISPDLSTQDPNTSSRRAASWATTSASSTARWCSRSRRRRSRKDLIWAGTNDGKLWYTQRRRREVERRDEEHHRAAAAGATMSQIEPSHFDPARRTSRSTST